VNRDSRDPDVLAAAAQGLAGAFTVLTAAALSTPEGKRAIADAVRPVVEEIVRKVLDERATDQWLSQAALAAYLSLSPSALSMRLSRGSSLAAIAVTDDKSRRKWRRGDVDGWLLAQRGDRAKLHAVGGGR
jgi:hypothetical protein